MASLALTLGARPSVVSALDAWRKKRNRASYGAAAAVSDQELGELIQLVEKLKADLRAWLQARHPELAP